VRVSVIHWGRFLQWRFMGGGVWERQMLGGGAEMSDIWGAAVLATGTEPG